MRGQDARNEPRACGLGSSPATPIGHARQELRPQAPRVRLALRAGAVDGLGRGGLPVGKRIKLAGGGKCRRADALVVSVTVSRSGDCLATDAQLRQHWPRPSAAHWIGGDTALCSPTGVRSHSTTIAAVRCCRAPRGHARLPAERERAGDHRRQATLPTLAAATLGHARHRNALRPSCERAMLCVAAASLWPLGSAPAAGWQAHRRPGCLPAARENPPVRSVRCRPSAARLMANAYDKPSYFGKRLLYQGLAAIRLGLAQLPAALGTEAWTAARRDVDFPTSRRSEFLQLDAAVSHPLPAAGSLPSPTDNHRRTQ